MFKEYDVSHCLNVSSYISIFAPLSGFFAVRLPAAGQAAASAARPALPCPPADTPRRPSGALSPRPGSGPITPAPRAAPTTAFSSLHLNGRDREGSGTATSTRSFAIIESLLDSMIAKTFSLGRMILRDHESPVLGARV